MPDGRVTCCQPPADWYVLKYEGRVDYTMAPAIDRYVDRLLHDGVVRPFLFDLSQARLLDSTNLGLLARIAEQVREANGRRSAIVCTSPDIEDVLVSMGFDEIFDIVSEHPECRRHTDEVVVSGKVTSQNELLRTMLEAHRTLAGLNEKDRQEFEGVVKMLEAELRN